MCVKNNNSNTSKCIEAELHLLLAKNDWRGLVDWLKNNPHAGDSLSTLLANSLNSQPLPKNFAASVIARLPKRIPELESDYQRFTKKSNQLLDWCLLTVYIAKAEILASQNRLERAVMEIWSAVCVIHFADDEEIPFMLNYLLLTCKSNAVFLNSIPLLLGIAAVKADKANEWNKRNQLVNAALRLAPLDEELLALIDRRCWLVSKVPSV